MCSCKFPQATLPKKKMSPEDYQTSLKPLTEHLPQEIEGTHKIELQEKKLYLWVSSMLLCSSI